MTTPIELFAQQHAEAANPNRLEIHHETDPALCWAAGALEVAAAAYAHAAAATEARLARQAGRQWLRGAHADIGFVASAMLPAGVSLASDTLPVSSLLGYLETR